MPIILQIQLLGGFQLGYGSERLTGLDSLRLQSLLAYLLLHRDTPHPRQRLAYLLYPDSLEGQARSNLRRLVHLLRRALPAADEFLQSDGQTLQWRVDAPFRLDVDEFEGAAAQLDSPAALELAVKLYQGALLPDCYDDWILPERERLHTLYLHTLERLVARLADEGNAPQAINYGQLLLRQDPLREQAYVQLMQLYARRGEVTSVQRTYQTCQHVLQQELKAEPSATTQAAYQAALHTARAGPVPSFRAPRRNHNLPLQLTSFVGREREMARIKQLLAETRLLTLTGAGGSGKTRLALQMAWELAPTLPDGVWLVELAPLADPSLVPLAVAKVLDVREVAGRPLVDALVEALAGKQLLLVLDNCDHLLPACVDLAGALLHQRQRLRILATSRARLNLKGEVVWHVPTLSLPVDSGLTSVDTLMASEAVRLFVERATAAQPTFALTPENVAGVAEISVRLDGMPLAIELAAARIRTLSVAQIAARLDQAFGLLTQGTRDAPARHQTLRATMDWSFDLLSEPERSLFRRLAVFAGSFSLDAAERVTSDEGRVTSTEKIDDEQDAFLTTRPPALAASGVLDLLSSLVDKSLVTLWDRQPAGQARYRLLEPVRQYAMEKLQAAGEEATRRARHLEFFLSLSTEAGPQLEGADQAAWLDRLEADLDNVRTALDWALQHGQTQTALQMVGSLRRLWIIRPHHREGIERLQAMLAQPEAATPTSARLTALNTYLMMLWPQYGLRDAQALIDEALALANTLDDPTNKAFALMWAGNAALSRGEAAPARAYLEQSLALWEVVGSRVYSGWTLLFLGEVALFEGNRHQARVLFAASLQPLREAGDPPFLAIPLRRLGQLALEEGDLGSAERLIRESMGFNWQVRDYRGTACCLAALAALAMARGRLSEAARLAGTVAAFLEFIRTPLLLYDQQQYDNNIDLLRAQMDETTFAQAWAAGRVLEREHAVDQVLARDDSHVT